MPDRIAFDSGRYALLRSDGGAGDSGGMLVSIDPTTGDRIGDNGEVVVGCRIQCGSVTARSFSGQDWWLTSVVEEIIQNNDDSALIRTKSGSLYYVGKDRAVVEAVRFHNTTIE